jgi:hypothetical protein
MVHDGDRKRAGGDSGETRVDPEVPLSASLTLVGPPASAAKNVGNSQTPGPSLEVGIDDRGGASFSAMLRLLIRQMSRVLVSLAW